MKSLISIIAFSGVFLMIIPFVHLSSKDQSDGYLRYKEQYTHNLKNPLIQRYRKLSCDPSKEMGKQEKEQEVVQ